MFWAGFNALCLFVLLKPLKKEEISLQWKKRRSMGKWLYSLYHLDDAALGIKTSSDGHSSGGHH